MQPARPSRLEAASLSVPDQATEDRATASQPVAALSGLKRIHIWGNWPVRDLTLPKYMVRGRGDQLEGLLERLVGRLREGEVGGNLRLGWSWEAGNKPGVSRALRVIKTLQPGHKVVTDVVLQETSGDLYVRLACKAFTWISIVRRLVFLLFFLVLLGGLFWYLLTSTGIYKGWVQDYATKYAPQYVHKSGTDSMPVDAKAMLAKYITDGGLLNSQSGFFWQDFRAFCDAVEPVKRKFQQAEHDLAQKDSDYRWYLDLSAQEFQELHSYFYNGPNWKSEKMVRAERKRAKAYVDATSRPWTKYELFCADPKVFLMSVSGIPVLIITIIFGGMNFTPRNWMRYVCVLLSWPMPDTFVAEAEAHAGSVMNALNKVQDSIGINKSDIIELGR